jgi:hypothetical protein
MKILKVDYRFFKVGKMNDNSDARWENASEVIFERRLSSLRKKENVDIVNVRNASFEEKENLAAMLDNCRNTEVDRWNNDEHLWAKENLPEYE